MLVKQVDIDNDIETEIHPLNLKTKYLRCDLITLFEPFCCNSNHDNRSSSRDHSFYLLEPNEKKQKMKIIKKENTFKKDKRELTLQQ